MTTSAQQHTDPAAAVLAAAGDAIVAVDAHGVINSWNQAAEALLGFSASDAMGQTLALIIPENHRPRHVAAFHAAVDSGELQHRGKPARIEALTKAGLTIPLVMSLGLEKGSDGTVTGAVAILRAENDDPVIFVARAAGA